MSEAKESAEWLTAFADRNVAIYRMMNGPDAVPPEPKQVRKAATLLLSQAERIERLEEALKPFAAMAGDNWHHQMDGMVIVAGASKFDLRLDFTLGDLRRAKQAMEDTP